MESNSLMECVPNFSEGRDKKVIEEIVSCIEMTEVEGEKAIVMHVDMGYAANRTVVTFAGGPKVVCEAAFQAAKKAAELIDMRAHNGVHPRLGATDVLPLVPIRGISLEECASLARGLAKRIFTELGIPCYCYEAAAACEQRKNLAWCRAGEYEALPVKLASEDERPDFGPQSYNEVVARGGACNVGARNFLIAVNFNLDTCDVSVAKEIAMDVRESGRRLPGGQGRIGGSMKGCKAIGWYIEEYRCVQVSMNITDIWKAPLHKVYEEVSQQAERRGRKVTGTEIIGLVPKAVIVDAGKYFAGDVNENEAIEKAIEILQLNVPKQFDAKKKIIEYLIGNHEKHR